MYKQSKVQRVVVLCYHFLLPPSIQVKLVGWLVPFEHICIGVPLGTAFRPCGLATTAFNMFRPTLVQPEQTPDRLRTA